MLDLPPHAIGWIDAGVVDLFMLLLFGSRNILAAAIAAPMERRQERVERDREEVSQLRAGAEAFFDATMRQRLLDIADQYEILAAMLPPERGAATPR